MSASIVLYRDRVAIVGMTESGKTGLARHLFESARCRRVLVDPKHSFRVKGVRPATSVGAIDWRAPLIHVQPPWHDKEFSNELYAAAFRRLRHALIWTDEAYGVSDSKWGLTSFAAIQTQGRELEIGHLVCTQRPVNCGRETFTEATHLFVVPPLDDDDLKTARQGMAFVTLERLRELAASVPQHGYIWVDRRARKVRIGDPLPAELYKPRLVLKRSERG